MPEKGIEAYSTRSETKAAFAEISVESVKQIIHCYTEISWQKYSLITSVYVCKEILSQ